MHAASGSGNVAGGLKRESFVGVVRIFREPQRFPSAMMVNTTGR
jgi:hypothetical protein